MGASGLVELSPTVWRDIKTAYGSAEVVPKLLEDCVAEGKWEQWDKLLNEVCHQGDTSEGAVAIVPHVIGHVLSHVEQPPEHALEITAHMVCVVLEGRQDQRKVPLSRFASRIVEPFREAVAEFRQAYPKLLPFLHKIVQGCHSADEHRYMEKTFQRIWPQYTATKRPDDGLSKRLSAIYWEIRKAAAWSAEENGERVVVRVTVPGGACRTSFLSREEFDTLKARCEIQPTQ